MKLDYIFRGLLFTIDVEYYDLAYSVYCEQSGITTILQPDSYDEEYYSSHEVTELDKVWLSKVTTKAIPYSAWEHSKTEALAIQRAVETVFHFYKTRDFIGVVKDLTLALKLTDIH